MLLRLDRALSENTAVSRSQLRQAIRSGGVTVNGDTVREEARRIDTACDRLTLYGEPVHCGPLYLMLNKPAGYVSATRSPGERTVLELVPPALMRKNLFPAGRLDKDTVGFLLLTDDGAFAHAILAPRRHVPKTYFVRAGGVPREGLESAFREGMLLADGERCLPAGFTLLRAPGPEGPLEARVELHEGMYHQIKRMFAFYGAGVLELHRVSMGALALDRGLAPGECRELTPQEVELLRLRRTPDRRPGPGFW